MKILLAGHNIDHEIIEEFQKMQPERQDLTPETVAAAYARISRNPRPVNELRQIARSEVEKARASNRNIVFEMGHSSIAEHAVFNLDILEVSRLLVEEIERFRLASYTEKSQRYVLLQDDFVIPEEVKQAGLEEPFVGTIRLQNGFYHTLYEKLRPWVFDWNPELASDPANRSLLEGWAKEDARYCLSLSTQTQLGMTVNARNIELMIRRLAACPLVEGQEYSRRLYDATQKVAPSLVRYTEPTPYDSETPEALRQEAAGIISNMASISPGAKPEKGPGLPASSGTGAADRLVRLLDATPAADEKIAAALLHSSSGLPFADCLWIAARMTGAEQASLIKAALRRMKGYDAAPRGFEHVGATFELTISATCFAQLKRHRMATITVQGYDPALGVTIPASIAAIGMESAFREICGRTEETWERIRLHAPAAAPYILTNAHRRRVMMSVSGRELYHLARVRADRSAQWDIRETAERMIAEGRKVMPLTLMLAAGKDGFDALRTTVFAGEG
jgi:flavin-dependent thymidylate synthase